MHEHADLFARRLRDLRKERGLTLRDLAKEYHGSPSQLHDFEKGRRVPVRRTAEALDEALGTGGEFVALLYPSPKVGGAAERTAGGGPDAEVTRRAFLLSFLAGLGLGAPAAALLGQDEPPRVGREHVDLVMAAMRELERQDAEHGGDQVCDGAAALLGRLHGWIQHGTYPADLEGALCEAAGQLGAWVGWTAYDADRHDMARRFWVETLLLARTRDDLQLEARVLSYVSLQARRQGRAREAVNLAQAGLRVSAGWTTPRMSALLHLRCAYGYASIKDVGAFRRHLARARHDFDKGPTEDDLPYLAALTPAEVTGIEGMAAVTLGRYDKATALFRQITEHPDPAYRRNTVYYTVRLADALHRVGDHSAAFQTGHDAVDAVAAVTSARTHRDLAALRVRAEHSKVAGEFRDHYDAVFAKGGQR